MALFSTTLATQNFSKINKSRAEAVNKVYENFEYKTFAAYKRAGGVANSLDDWKGADGKWLRSDRKQCNPRWQCAVSAIIKNKMQNRLMPFEQVADFYRYTQVLVNLHKHQSQWLYGAYYLVSDLADIYDQGLTLDMVNKIADLAQVYAFLGFENFKELLVKLNRAIANYAIRTPFYDLLFGQYKNSPRTSLLAWQFDKKFIMAEQGSTVAFTVYNDDQYSQGRFIENIVFNNAGFILRATEIKRIVYIPVFPEQYDSDLTDNIHNYGQDARIKVPLAMLYPNQYFYNDTASTSVDLQLKDTKFGQTLKRGQSKRASVNSENDRDVYIYMSYYQTNRIIKKRFNKINSKR